MRDGRAKDCDGMRECGVWFKNVRSSEVVRAMMVRRRRKNLAVGCVVETMSIYRVNVYI